MAARRFTRPDWYSRNCCRAAGAHAPEHRSSITSRLFPLIVPTPDDHIEAARLRNECRRHGIQVRTIYALLAQTFHRPQTCHAVDRPGFPLHRGLHIASALGSTMTSHRHRPLPTLFPPCAHWDRSDKRSRATLTARPGCAIGWRAAPPLATPSRATAAKQESVRKPNKANPKPCERGLNCPTASINLPKLSQSKSGRFELKLQTTYRNVHYE